MSSIKGISTYCFTIERVSQFKLLAITTDERLSWKQHTANTWSNLSRAVAIIRKLKGLINYRWSIASYNAFLQLNSYCTSIRAAGGKTKTNPISMLLHCALKLILKLPQRTLSELYEF